MIRYRSTEADEPKLYAICVKMLEQILYFLDKLGIFAIAFLFLLLGYRPPWWKRRQKDIPGPLALPILGTRWIFTLGSYKFNKIHKYYEAIYEKYGPVVKEEALFNVPVINVFEKEDIEAVLRCTSKYPIRPPTEAIAYYRRSRPDRYASTGLVNEQGEKWHFLRTALTTDLTSPKTISAFSQEVHEIAEDWCNLIENQRDENGKINNVEQLAGKLGLETICALVLGRRMGFLLLEGESDKARELAEAVHQHFLASRDTYFGLPFWKLIETPAYKKLLQSEEKIYSLTLELIESADEATRESVIFQSILKADIDEREKTAAIIDFIAAGIHTLKNSFLFLLHTVAEHPEVQNNILRDSAYLKACINETFRYIPTANCLARINEEELELGGFKIKPGNVIVCHNAIACRDDRNYKNANEFRPERWLGDEKTETLHSSTYLVAPFGVGRRICPGKRFIESVLPIFLRSTVQKFNLKAVKPLELEFEFLISPKGPISIIFNDREE